MQKPVFLSIGGQSDAAFAKQVHAQLSDSLSYHYQITGEENVKFRSEIESQIQGCYIFVVFWSEDYLNSIHAKNELAFFRKIVESQTGIEKELIVVPRTQGKPDIQSCWTNPITQKNEFILGRWREERAIDAEADAIRVAMLIRRKLSKFNTLSEAIITRGWLLDQFKSAISMPNYQSRELLFISGLQGDGRRSALRQYMQKSPNRIERQIFLDAVDGPDDLLFQLMDAASISTINREEIIKSIKEEKTTQIKEIRKILHQARDNKSYYIINIDRYIGIDGPSIPLWLSDTFNVFKLGANPLIFVVTSSLISNALLTYYPDAAVVRIPGLEVEEMRELVYLLSLEDKSNKKWTEEKRIAIAKACGSSPSLCKSVMQALYLEPTLDFVEKIAHRADENFGQALASLMAHWVQHYSHRTSDLLALRVIEKLGVTSKDALDEIMEPAVLKHGEYDLYDMRSQGLVEQLSDGIYRIPPLVQRRLGAALWSKHEDLDVDHLFKNFSKKIQVAKTEYGAIYAINAINVSLRAGGGIAAEYDHYITLAMLFKSGFDRYTNKDYKLAHSTLQRAMQHFKSKAIIVDITTKIEICRYAGLAAVRTNDLSATQIACNYLDTEFNSTKRQKSAKAMALFIMGFQLRINKKFKDAIEKFEKAIYILKDTSKNERQLAAIYTELATAHLGTTPPNFSKALQFAEMAYQKKAVNHTLNAHIYALIMYVYKSNLHITLDEIQKFTPKIEDLLEKLTIRSTELGQDFHINRRRDYKIEHNLWIEKYESNEQNKTQPTQNKKFTPTELDFL